MLILSAWKSRVSCIFVKALKLRGARLNRA